MNYNNSGQRFYAGGWKLYEYTRTTQEVLSETGVGSFYKISYDGCVAKRIMLFNHRISVVVPRGYVRRQRALDGE